MFRKKTDGRSAEPVGIGGWLLLPILGFVLIIFKTAIDLVHLYQTFSGIQLIFSAEAGRFAALRAPVILSLLGGTLVLASAVSCLILLVRRSPLIVPVATAHYLILVVTALVDVWADSMFSQVLPNEPRDPKVVRDAVRVVIAALIWIPYFHKSRRVRNTFGRSDSVREPDMTQTPATASENRS